MLLYASALWNASFDWIWIKLGIVNMSLKGSYFQCCNRAILLHTSPKLEVYNCSLLARVFMKHKKAAILRFHYIWHKWDHLIRCPGQYFKRRALDLKLILQLRITSLCRKIKTFSIWTECHLTSNLSKQRDSLFYQSIAQSAHCFFWQ